MVNSVLTGTFVGLDGGLVVLFSRFDPLIKWSDYLQGHVLVLDTGKHATKRATGRADPQAIVLPDAPTQPMVTRGNTLAPTRAPDASEVPRSPLSGYPDVPLTKLPPCTLDEQAGLSTGECG